MNDLFGAPELSADNDNDIDDHSRLGRYAEFLVCADITQNGYYASHIDAAGFDVLLVSGHKSYRVQVKSSSVIRGSVATWRCRINKGSARGNAARKRAVDRRDADILALYHHVLGTIAYYPIKYGVSLVSLPIRQLRTVPSSETLGAALVYADETTPAVGCVFVDVAA